MFTEFQLTMKNFLTVLFISLAGIIIAQTDVVVTEQQSTERAKPATLDGYFSQLGFDHATIQGVKIDLLDKGVARDQVKIAMRVMIGLLRRSDQAQGSVKHHEFLSAQGFTADQISAIDEWAVKLAGSLKGVE